MELLDSHEISLRLESLKNWAYEEKSLVKEFIFKDFSSALSFVIKVGLIAEKVNHHPDMLIHSYNKVIIRSSTHRLGGVTEKDFELSELIEKN